MALGKYMGIYVLVLGAGFGMPGLLPVPHEMKNSSRMIQVIRIAIVFLHTLIYTLNFGRLLITCDIKRCSFKTAYYIYQTYKNLETG